MSHDLLDIRNIIAENQALQYQLERLAFERDYLMQGMSELRQEVVQLRGLTKQQQELILELGAKIHGQQKTIGDFFQQLTYANGQVSGYKGFAEGRRDLLKAAKAETELKPKGGLVTRIAKALW